MIRIIGIGAPFGDDAVGLILARILALEPPPGCEVLASDRPGAGLIDLLEGAEAAILIDAVRSGAPPGTVHQLTFSELARHSGRFVSSHELGVAESVQLAEKLQRLPGRGGVLGIEIGIVPAYPQEYQLSRQIMQIVQEGVARVRTWAASLSR